jgi:hypothetical protein
MKYIGENISTLKIKFRKDDKFNKPIRNLPLTVNKIIISRKNKKYLLEKIHFGCKIYDKFLSRIFL